MSRVSLHSVSTKLETEHYHVNISSVLCRARSCRRVHHSRICFILCCSSSSHRSHVQRSSRIPCRIYAHRRTPRVRSHRICISSVCSALHLVSNNSVRHANTLREICSSQSLPLHLFRKSRKFQCNVLECGFMSKSGLTSFRPQLQKTGVVEACTGASGLLHRCDDIERNPGPRLLVPSSNPEEGTSLSSTSPRPQRCDTLLKWRNLNDDFVFVTEFVIDFVTCTACPNSWRLISRRLLT